MSRKQPRFHCTSEKQKKVIAAKCAQRKDKQKIQTSSRQIKPSVSDKANKITRAKSPFRLPLQNGGHCWNIYRVSNSILNGKQDGDVHGGLVINEENNNVILVEVTHSSKNGKRNNTPVRNLVSSDTDKNTEKLRNCYIRRKLVVSITTKNGIQGIDVSHLNKQMNDLQFTEDEKKQILAELSHLSTSEGQYLLFKDLSQKKTDT